MRRLLKRRSQIVLVAVAVVLLVLTMIYWVATLPSNKANAQEVETVASISDIVEDLAMSLGGEVIVLDPVINPTASLVVNCDGSGEVVFDNRAATIGQGFELVIDSVVTTYRFVEAGDMLTHRFPGGAPVGSVVVVQTGAGTPIPGAEEMLVPDCS